MHSILELNKNKKQKLHEKVKPVAEIVVEKGIWLQEQVVGTVLGNSRI